jgi:hypothetical protein
MPSLAEKLTTGNSLLLFVSLVTSAGPYIFDWNETHIYNTLWMPHCKFHNGQTMSMGLLLGVLTIWYTFRSVPYPTAVNESQGDSKAALTACLLNQKRREDINTAAILAALYWVTQGSAIFYPGSRMIDPPGDERYAAQPYLVMVLLSITFAGWSMETKRIPAEHLHDE